MTDQKPWPDGPDGFRAGVMYAVGALAMRVMHVEYHTLYDGELYDYSVGLETADERVALVFAGKPGRPEHNVDLYLRIAPYTHLIGEPESFADAAVVAAGLLARLLVEIAGT